MLSIIIITLNEEDKIRDCLESVKWGDEIIVVDCFSQDNTVRIAEEYTDKVYKREFTGFGEQKKWLILKLMVSISGRIQNRSGNKTQSHFKNKR